MKSQIKLIGIDDGPFEFQDESTVLIGVVMRANGYLEGVLRREISIDGSEATSVIIDMIKKTRHHIQTKAILIDGVAVGGFNIIDISKVYEQTGLPVITVTRNLPDLDDIKTALKGHFSDWKPRFDLIKKGILYKLETKHNPLYFNCAGVDEHIAKEIITISTIRGVIPEPIRVAHVIASGISRGESVGKA
jgi:endonuclease V-like protein UPF0215 family